MTPNQTNEIIRMLIAYFGELPRRPDWADEFVKAAWRQLLTPFEVDVAVTALNDYRLQLADRISMGGAVYFPIIDEFGNYLRKVATAAEREAIRHDALSATIRCDGSRWIDNTPGAQGRRPFPSLGEGVVACPACNPTTHERQQHGDQHEHTPRGAQASPPPCRPSANEFVGDRHHQQRWARALAQFIALPLTVRGGFRLPEPDDGGNLLRLEAFLAANPAAKAELLRRPPVGRSIAELDLDPADSTPRPGDAARSCPWCGGTVTRTQMPDWWICEIGECSTTAQIDAGPGGGRRYEVENTAPL